MNEAIQNLTNRIIEDYNYWTHRAAKGELTEINKRMMKEFAEKVEVKEGRKYIKIIQNNAVWGFIVATNEDKKFNYGDILMAAGYNAPARNKARGNVFALENLQVRWTGANYL